jgi:hypothetical protein
MKKRYWYWYSPVDVSYSQNVEAILQESIGQCAGSTAPVRSMSTGVKSMCGHMQGFAFSNGKFTLLFTAYP